VKKWRANGEFAGEAVKERYGIKARKQLFFMSGV
jgi:hypothetical protein